MSPFLESSHMEHVVEADRHDPRPATARPGEGNDVGPIDDVGEHVNRRPPARSRGRWNGKCDRRR